MLHRYCRIFAGFIFVLLLGSCSDGAYLMRLDYDPKDISEVNVYLIKEDKEIPFHVIDNNIVISPNEIIGVGSIKVEFKSNIYGIVTYEDDFIAEGRELDVSCETGRIVIAVKRSGYL